MRFIFKVNCRASASTFASRDAAYAAGLLCAGGVIAGVITAAANRVERGELVIYSWDREAEPAGLF